MPFAPCWKKLFDMELGPITDLLTLTKPIPKLNLTNYGATANTNIVSTDTSQGLKAKNPPCLFRIYVVFGTSGVFSVQRTAGNATQTENLNQGVALTANAAYMFDILAETQENIDFQTTVTGTILKLLVVEKGDVK
jgi:hypothetical protein